MACKEWEEWLVSDLYDELDEERRDDLRHHLERCEACRAAQDELAGARSVLRDASPEIPPSRQVLVLERPTRFAARWRGFAAGFAAATILLAAGWLVGRASGPAGTRLTHPSGGDAVPVAEFIDRDTFQSALDQQRSEYRSLFDRPAGDEVDAALVNLQAAWEQQRREDLEFVLRQIAAAEVRTGTRIGENRQALRYIALSDRPDLTER